VVVKPGEREWIIKPRFIQPISTF